MRNSKLAYLFTHYYIWKLVYLNIKCRFYFPSLYTIRRYKHTQIDVLISWFVSLYPKSVLRSWTFSPYQGIQGLFRIEGYRHEHTHTHTHLHTHTQFFVPLSMVRSLYLSMQRHFEKSLGFCLGKSSELLRGKLPSMVHRRHLIE